MAAVALQVELLSGAELRVESSGVLIGECSDWRVWRLEMEFIRCGKWAISLYPTVQLDHVKNNRIQLSRYGPLPGNKEI
jgi:hypothetical protein